MGLLVALYSPGVAMLCLLLGLLGMSVASWTEVVVIERRCAVVIQGTFGFRTRTVIRPEDVVASTNDAGEPVVLFCRPSGKMVAFLDLPRDDGAFGRAVQEWRAHAIEASGSSSAGGSTEPRG